MINSCISKLWESTTIDLKLHTERSNSSRLLVQIFQGGKIFHDENRLCQKKSESWTYEGGLQLELLYTTKKSTTNNKNKHILIPLHSPPTYLMFWRTGDGERMPLKPADLRDVNQDIISWREWKISGEQQLCYITLVMILSNLISSFFPLKGRS